MPRKPRIHFPSAFYHVIARGNRREKIFHNSSHISPDLFYTHTRNRQGALGRSIVGYLGRKLGGYQIKGTAEHFNRDPVVMSQGIKRLDNKLNEEKGLAKTIISIETSLIQKRSCKILI